ncbi:PQQ-dependent sugar dehydrogenase [Catellatospora citrea]|uniref:Glucose/arabinose dehydrogenase n=1 Tax=Catellatospora citrea TaxID=53366 RepID=A0A8J3KP91_9ACTN|nr:PQQ-dependent sugar dehydrogenase [Catellatospora citrea]RKE02728.1 glucose/arabinose dehydrogenase [Catellatospora citrea]GIF99559.1 hypothetical protein Cci01nite_46530 [Catellatospora citrea]
MRTSRRRLAVLLTATTVLVAAGAVTAISAQAAAGCRVTYTISSQWSGGFGANVSITNLGDPVSSWQVGWTFGAGQTITQLWNGSHTQSGSQVTVRNAPYNGALATNASTAFGFNGSWTGSNPIPATFTMNGVTCTGTTTPSSPPPSSPAPGDTQPPTVPGNARISNLTCSSVTFAWNAATDDVGVAYYDIYHDGQQMTSVGGGTLSANLTVVPGATWGLYVNARDAAGNVSQASSTVTITPPQCQTDTTPPTAATQLAGSASGTTVTLQWTAATDDVGVRAYDVHRGGVVVGTVSGNPPATTFIDSGLAANTTYQYQVRARDAAGNTGPASNTATVTTTGGCTVCTVTQVTTDTDIPWGLATLPDGSVVYSRRDAHDVIRLNPVTGAKTTLGTVPNVQSTDGEGGLLGIAVAPTYATDGWLYVMHTSPTDNRVVRIRVVNDRLDTATLTVLVSGMARNKYHDGGRLRFGPDGKLYASSGDAQNGSWAQDRNRLEGKILRLNPDGTVPADNPFGNLVWSYGHRNPQGLAFDSQGRLWEQEFGNTVMDETNLIERGGNYGWPNCEGTTGTCGTAGFLAPKRTYPTSEGSCSGIAVVRDALYVACLRGTRLYRAVISGTSLTNVQSYFVGTYGRLRTVEPSPSGGIWLTTSNNGDKDSVPNNSNERILHVALG